jgi:hypothetical protein
MSQESLPQIDPDTKIYVNLAKTDEVIGIKFYEDGTPNCALFDGKLYFFMNQDDSAKLADVQKHLNGLRQNVTGTINNSKSVDSASKKLLKQVWRYYDDKKSFIENFTRFMNSLAEVKRSMEAKQVTNAKTVVNTSATGVKAKVSPPSFFFTPPATAAVTSPPPPPAPPLPSGYVSPSELADLLTGSKTKSKAKPKSKAKAKPKTK